MLTSGIINEWPKVINSSISDAPLVLQSTANQLLSYRSLFSIVISISIIIYLEKFMRNKANTSSLSSSTWLVSSSVLKTTLLVDGLFLMTVLIEPRLSGLI